MKVLAGSMESALPIIYKEVDKINELITMTTRERPGKWE